MINNTNGKVDLNSQDNDGWTPLTMAVYKGNEQTVTILCDEGKEKVKILEFLCQDGKNSLDVAVTSGVTSIFAKLLKTLFTRQNIHNPETLKKSGLLGEKKITRWMGWCYEKNNSGLLAFLTNLQEKALKCDNFGLLVLLLDINNTATGNNTAASIQSIIVDVRKQQKISDYLYSKLKKESLMDISFVVNNGLLSQECGFNDSLLFLSNLVDSEQFNDTLQAVTTECLTKKCKNVKKYQFFKNNLLNSNVWGLPAAPKRATATHAATIGKDDEKQQETDTIKNEDSDNSDSSDRSVFDAIEANIILEETALQQKYIKDEICQIEKEFCQEWQELKYSIKEYNLGHGNKISQNSLINRFDLSQDLMKFNTNIGIGIGNGIGNGIDINSNSRGIQADFKLNEMPIDNANGFIGSNEYDINSYLTKILISSHQCDPIFQKECKKYFNINNPDFGVDCVYTAAPVKTRERATLKANDYIHLDWPHSSHILDYLRCSVVFKDVRSLVKGFNKFYSKYNDWRNINEQNGCIKCIVRIKNDFSKIGDNAKDLELNSFGYSDIKCNVLIQYNNVSIIGEIQWLLSFMLNAKKISHGIYTFARKKELYNGIYQTINVNISGGNGIGTKEIKENENYYRWQGLWLELNTIIVCRNMKQFSLFFETIGLQGQLYEYICKNSKTILSILEENQWHSGIKLFKLVVKSIGGE